jgi:hypothetical protein
LAGGTAGAARAGGAATDAYDGIGKDVDVDVHGLVDVYAQANFNRPATGQNAFRAFDVTNGLNLGALRLTAAHRPDPTGFRLDVALGTLADGYLRSDPAAGAYPDVSQALSHVEQAFATAVVPVGEGIAVDAGKFGTPVGIEDNETPTNASYSRSLLFTLAEPTYHTGLRATYAPSDAIAVSAFWVNGWNANVLEGNGMRGFGAAATWSPEKNVQVVVDYMGGPERAPTQLDAPALAFRHEVDAYVRYDPTERLSMVVTADYGRDAAHGGVDWWGVEAYLRWVVLTWLSGTVRAEHLADPDGFVSGFRQRLAGATLTLEVKDRAGPVTLIGRLEYRRDQSNARVFDTATILRATRQDTLTAAAIATF